MLVAERIGDFLAFPAFAKGSSASVHLARLVRTTGFQRLVVLKRLHKTLVHDKEAAARLLSEARLASRVRSPYVVPILDVVTTPGALCLVMELVQGVTLGRLMELAIERSKLLEPSVVVAIFGNVLRGLHTAHEAVGEDRQPLGLVHRDVAPGNVLVGADGLARVLDFGIAKALGDARATATGEVRGTLAYMSPEQLRGAPVTRLTDIYSAGALCWEALTGKRLREDANATAALLSSEGAVTPPSQLREGLSATLDEVLLRALKNEPSQRFPSANAMAAALEAALPPAATDDVIKVLEELAFDDLDRLREQVTACEAYVHDATDGDRETARQDPAPAENDVEAWPVFEGALVAGKYRVERVLGRGGMGVVLGAKHIELGELVAIKVIKGGIDDTTAERFVREARAASRVKGEHVVRVIDVGRERGVPYLVMERLEGGDLRSVLAAWGPLAIDEAVLYVLHACEALAEAHSLGIVHRDLKPANLFLGRHPDGSPLVKVLDFGIAKTQPEGGEDHISLTATRDVLGSPAYMSPEQIRRPKDVDARADIWALGVVLYELLTGKHPFFDENSMAVLARIYAEDPTPIRDLRPDVPNGLVAVVARCLKKDVDARFANVAELASALEPFAPAGQVSTGRIKRMSLAPAANAAPTIFRDGPSAKSDRARSRRTMALVALALVAAAGVVMAMTLGPKSGAATSNDPPKPLMFGDAATETPVAREAARDAEALAPSGGETPGPRPSAPPGQAGSIGVAGSTGAGPAAAHSAPVASPQALPQGQKPRPPKAGVTPPAAGSTETEPKEPPRPATPPPSVPSAPTPRSDPAADFR